MRDLPFKASTIQPSMLVVILRSLSLLKSYLVRVLRRAILAYSQPPSRLF